MDERSRFKFSAAERTIEIEGPESFVSEQIAQMKDVIAFFIEHQPTTPSSATPTLTVTDVITTETITASISAPSEQQQGGLEAYPNTFDTFGDEVKIIATVPGDNKRHQMKNVGLIYGYACSIRGQETFPADEVRDICINHGILDAPNFLKAFTDKTIFIIGGVKGGKKTFKLTLAGKKAGLALISEIEANAN